MIAVTTIAPVMTMVWASTACVTCCSISSMFSTSRTTLVWTIDVDTRVWKPIDRLCRRAARALRRSAPLWRTDAHEQPRPQHVHRVVLRERDERDRRPEASWFSGPPATTRSITDAVTTGMSHCGESLIGKIRTDGITRRRYRPSSRNTERTGWAPSTSTGALAGEAVMARLAAAEPSGYARDGRDVAGDDEATGCRDLRAVDAALGRHLDDRAVEDDPHVAARRQRSRTPRRSRRGARRRSSAATTISPAAATIDSCAPGCAAQTMSAAGPSTSVPAASER